jgi:Uma2 family endonuclease
MDAMAASQPIVLRIPKANPNESPLVIPGESRPVNHGADWFFDLCAANEQWQFERTAEGEIIVIAPPGGESSYRESRTFLQLELWASKNKSGVAFISSAGFILPNGAQRFPDAAWVKRTRLATLTPEQKRKFMPLCPDFVLEVLSPSDRLPRLKAKMQEYRKNGAQLGWLIDPDRRKVYVYRPGKPVEILQSPVRLSGAPEMPGFFMKMAEIWDPDL